MNKNNHQTTNSKRYRHLLVVVLLLLFAIACTSTEDVGLDPGLYARIDTTHGEILIRLEPERAPMTVMNFVGLAEGTMDTIPESDEPFYDGLTFHRVEPGFVVQGGDPAGNGSGGPGYQFPTETHPELLHDGPGVVAMANSGPNTNGSQFYITLGVAAHLDGGYNVFGKVVNGQDFVGNIAIGDTMNKVEIIRSGDEYAAYSASSDSLFAMVEAATAESRAIEAAARQKSLDEVFAKFTSTESLADTGILIDTGSSNFQGEGALPETGETISIHLKIELVDGTVLDDTRASERPFTFAYKVQRILEGPEIVIGTLKVGDRVKAIVPPELGFGMQGSPPTIPPGSYVVFEIERLPAE